MLFIKQTKFYNREKEQHGNCLSACLASILELQLYNVPEFWLFKDEWFEALKLFLLGFNYSITMNRAYDNNELPEFGTYIVNGMANRGVRHSVIYKDRNPLFDPHTSNDFLIDIDSYYLIKRI